MCVYVCGGGGGGLAAYTRALPATSVVWHVVEEDSCLLPSAHTSRPRPRTSPLDAQPPQPAGGAGARAEARRCAVVVGRMGPRRRPAGPPVSPFGGDGQERQQAAGLLRPAAGLGQERQWQ